MITCQFEDGNKVSLRHVVTDTLLFNEKSEILLVKRAPHLLCGNMYGIVGGYVERDETTNETVRREVLEETGYEVYDLFLFRVIDNPNRPKEDRQNISFVYVATAGEKTGKPDNESLHTKWFPFDKLPREEEFAFDHYEDIELYKKYLLNKCPLPIFG